MINKMEKYHTAFKPYLNDLAARKPAPGGGSAVCLFACLGISLIEKAIRYSVSAKNPGQSVKLTRAARTLVSMRKKILPLVDRDGYLFGKIMTSNGDARRIWLAKSEALIVEMAKTTRLVFLLAKEVESGIKKGILSDFAIGIEALRLAIGGCAQNLEANESLFGRKNKFTAICKRYAAR